VAYSISAFFPAYNDAGTIASMVVSTDITLRALPASYPYVSDDYEIIVVNDGSPDHTGQILAELTERYPRLRVVTHEKNRGYGGALRSGFSNATRDLIFYTDGDAQYDPRELERLVSKLSDDVDMVQGYKIARSDPLERKLIGKVYHQVVNLLFNLRMRDVDCDFRLIRREVFDAFQLERNSGIICVELMTKFRQAGGRLVEVPVHHYHRAYGKSQFFNFGRVGRVGVDLLKLWLELRVLRRGAPRAIRRRDMVS
jgi:glycosyltransferase involved in cell wall biosynthesis